MSLNDILSYTGTISLGLSGIIYYFYKSSSAQYDSLQKARHSSIKQLPQLVQQHTQYVTNSSSYPSSSPSSSSPLYVCVEGIVSTPAPLATRWPSVIGNAATKAMGIYHVLTETSITTKLMPLSRLPWYDTEQPKLPDVHSVPFMSLDPNDRMSCVSLPALSTLSLPTSHGIESLLRFAGTHFISSELKYDEAMQNFQTGAIPKGTRFDEQLIPVDTRMTVFGHATMEGGEVKIGEYDFLHGVSPTRPFFVSSLPYSHIMHHAKQERARYYYSLIGTLLISCSSFMILGIKYGYSYYQTRQEMARLESFRIKRKAAAIKKKRKQQQQLQLQQQQQRMKTRVIRRTTNKNTTPTSTPPPSRLPSHPPTLSSSRSRSRYDDEEMQEKEGFPSNEGRHGVSRRPPPLPPVHHRSSSRTRMMSDPHDESEWEMDTDGAESWDEKSPDLSHSSSDMDLPLSISDESDVSDADTMCVICLHVRADAVMLDCGHMYTCVTCAEKCHKCPVCRANIKRVVKVFSNA